MTLRIVIMAMAIGVFVLTVVSLRNVMFGIYSQAAIALLIYVPSIIGVWRLMQWGRWLALSILWLYVVVTVTPFGMLSILSEINGDEFPLPIWQEMARVSPLAIASVFCLEILYSYGGEFRFSGNRSLPADSAPSENRPPNSWVLWTLSVVAIPALVIFMVTWELKNLGGCIPLADSPSTAVPLAPSLPVIFLGSLLFWRASPIASNRRYLVTRVSLYVALLFLFRIAVGSYVWYYSRC